LIISNFCLTRFGEKEKKMMNKMKKEDVEDIIDYELARLKSIPCLSEKKKLEELQISIFCLARLAMEAVGEEEGEKSDE
jgi:hypothetical protein